MFNGVIYLTCDDRLFMESIANGYAGVIISGNIPNNHPLVTTTGASIGSLLLPPPTASMAEVDGDVQRYINIYREHLYQQNQMEFISALLAGIYKGRNIIIYMTPEEFQMSFPITLLQFFTDTFGVNIGTETRPFSINPNTTSTILCMMYLNNMINAQEFFQGQPKYLIEPVDMIANKLFLEQLPYINPNPSITDIVEYYINMINSGTGMLINPVQFKR